MDTQEYQFIRGLQERKGIFAGLTPPTGRTTNYRSMVSNLAAQSPNSSEFGLSWAKYTEGVVGKEHALETINLKDYLIRTLPTAIEYIFKIILYGKNRNFSLWKMDEWCYFYGQIVDLNKDLIASVCGEAEIRKIYDYLESGCSAREVFINHPVPDCEQTIFAILQEILPQAMTEAIRHALENNLIDAGYLTIDRERAQYDNDYLDTHFSGDANTRKRDLLVELKEKVGLALQEGYQLIGGETGFVDRILTQAFYRYSIKQSNPKLKDQSRESENEMWVQIIVMIKRITKGIIKLMTTSELVTNTKIIGFIEEFTDGRAGCMEACLRKNDWWLSVIKNRNEQEYDQLLLAIKDLADVFIELDHWPILTRVPTEKYKIKYGIAIWLTNLLQTTNTSLPQIRLANFQTGVEYFMADESKMREVILEGKWT